MDGQGRRGELRREGRGGEGKRGDVDICMYDSCNKVSRTAFWGCYRMFSFFFFLLT